MRCTVRLMAYDVMNELRWSGPLRRGDRSAEVRRLQEWLLVDRAVKKLSLDGDFGPGTEGAVKAFQAMVDVEPTGVADENTLGLLTAPLRAALQPMVVAPGTSLGEACALYAESLLPLGIREIVPNLGPYVRWLMRGQEGTEWPWCAGAMRQVVHHGCAAVGLAAPPFAQSVGCARLARNAQAKGRFLKGKTLGPRNLRGALFVIPQPSGRDWFHTGIVLGDHAEEGFVRTAEGNSNLAGSAEGTDFLLGKRRRAKMDYLLLDA